jgi:hypothetical protein
MNDENILRIPITLKKRTKSETAAYFEGFLSGLISAKSAISKSIENYEATLKLTIEDYEEALKRDRRPTEEER